MGHGCSAFVGGTTPIPVSSTGQALTFPHRGGRENLDSGFRRNDGCGVGGGHGYSAVTPPSMTTSLPVM